jgi:hypothetical protein
MRLSRKYDEKGKAIIAVAVLSFLILGLQAFGQSSSSLSGTVTDASQAVLPGSTVTATNVDTGIKTTAVANGVGVYNFSSLQPGTYKVTVELKGFQTTTKTDVKLGMSAQVRLNFEMAVANVATQIEVSTTAADMLLESSSTTGTVLEEKAVTALPLVGNDMMSMINIMGGVVRQTDTLFGNASQTFAGVNSNNVNIQKDGITVKDVRFQDGVVSPSRINPEMVGEFRLVLSPVDAEMGRGAAQVQVLTKSGSNSFHGSGVWSVMNTALDANEWDNNRKNIQPNWRNINEYTISAGGPIIKNKTFFFVTWDQQIARQKSIVTTPVLTPCARKGIFRYFTGWVNGNAQQVTTFTPGSPTRAVVKPDGTPLVPTINADGTPYTGTLRWQSVLGQLTPAANSQIAADPINCSQYAPSGLSFAGTSSDVSAQQAANGLVAGSNWDTNRNGYDRSGYISRFSALMPMPNDYFGGNFLGIPWGDGLNVADLSWLRTTSGNDTVFGTGMDNARKSLSIKIDHNLSQKHRLSGTYTYETDQASAAEASWPNVGLSGATDRKPQSFVVSFTSTLRPTLLNEFRVGLSYNDTHNIDATQNPNTGNQMKAVLQQLLPTTNFPKWSGLPVVIGPGNGGTSFVPDDWSVFFGTFQSAGVSNPLGSRGALEATWGDKDSRWTYADTVSWTKSAHSFKVGAEVRLARSQQDTNGWAQFTFSSNYFPYVQGGHTVNSPPSGLSSPAGLLAWPGLVGFDFGSFKSGSYSQAYNLMDYMAGSVSAIRQYYFANSSTATNWNDPSTNPTRLLDFAQREVSLFFKDDWKVTNSLTLNLGMRYDYYGVPWARNGMTVGFKGGANSLFGGTGSWTNWQAVNPTFDSTKLTQEIFVGPNSPNPDMSAYNKDLNNFGPAVGFAWQLPWLGKGKTTLRGGYQLSYIPISTMDPNVGYVNVLGNAPGTIYHHEYAGTATVNPYLDLSTLPNLVPTSQFWDGSVLPLQSIPVTDRSQNISAYDPDIRSPYIQTLTLALTRSIGSALTVDVRYIGTLSRKQIGTLNLNSANFINNGLLQAFYAARAGGESALLNRLILPNTLVNGVISGAEQLRAYSSTQTALATGNFASLAGSLATTNGIVATPAGASTTGGYLLRNSGTPENFIYANPQFSAANWMTNLDHANYHSMQAQVTMRPIHGLMFQTSYTFSKNLGDTGTYTDVLNRQADYGILSSNRTHNMTTYGTYTLPFGANGLLFHNSSTAVRKIAEGWQVSWVGYVSSGSPASVTTVSSMWAGSGADLVRPDLFNAQGGHVTWQNGAADGRYYGYNNYMQVADPQCATIAPALVAACGTNLHALALVAGVNSNGIQIPGPVVFQHAQPGVRGNFQPNSLTGPGMWGLDLAMSKNYEFMEGKSINVRVDAQNILNHAAPSGTAPTTNDSRNYGVTNPNFDLNNTNPFGFVGFRGGHRVFSAKIRLSF